MVPIMENVTGPMPAKRALAALDQPAAADIGPMKRISPKVRAAIDAMVSGECKNITKAGAKVGLARESLSRALSVAHIAPHHRAPKSTAAQATKPGTARVTKKNRHPEDVTLDRRIKGICRGC
jgi:hypothetical protein